MPELLQLVAAIVGTLLVGTFAGGFVLLVAFVSFLQFKA
jgi:hypothetical protein